MWVCGKSTSLQWLTPSCDQILQKINLSGERIQTLRIFHYVWSHHPRDILMNGELERSYNPVDPIYIFTQNA